MAEEKLTGWKLYASWLGLLCLGWVIAGVVVKLIARLFFLGWDLI